MFLQLSHIIFEIALTVALAIAAGYGTHASVDLTTGDKHTDSAKTLLVWSSVLSWLTVIATIISLIGMIVFAEEVMASSLLRKVVGWMMYVVLGVTVIIGIMLAIAASDIKKGTNYIHNKDEHTYASSGAVVALLMGGGFLVVYGAIKAYDYYQHGSLGHHGALHHKNTGGGGGLSDYAGDYMNNHINNYMDSVKDKAKSSLSSKLEKGLKKGLGYGLDGAEFVAENPELAV